MFLTTRRIVLILAVAAVAGAIIVLPYISSLTATGLDKVTIELSDIEFVPASDEQRTSQIDIVFHLTNPTDKTVDALMKLDLPAGVDVEIKAFGKEHTK